MTSELGLTFGEAKLVEDLLRVRMREDWNRRARENAEWFIASDVHDDRSFRISGERDVSFSLRGLDNRWLLQASTLEIGCGIGRMTEHLLPRVLRLLAVDVATEMVAKAKERLGDRPNLHIVATTGADLSDVTDETIDFVLCYIVFQHIPKSIAQNYFREIRRILTPSGLFRGQVSRIREPGFVQPMEADTFSMRSWELDEVRRCFDDWKDVQIEVVQVAPMTDHLWITARP